MNSLESFMNRFGADGSPREWTEAYELDPPSPKKVGFDSFFSKFGGAMESYWFYDHTVELRFDTDKHIYYLVGTLGNLLEQNGVTNTVHIINAAEMLVPWAAKMTVAKLLRLIPTETVDGVLRIKPITFEEFTTIALEAKSAHKDKLDEAGDIGHMAHKCLEDSIRRAITLDPEKIVRDLVNIPEDERAATAANNAKSWMDQHNVKWIETETKIYSKQHQYAGTMDGLAYVSSCNDRSCCREHFVDRLSLIDWKSSNYLKIEYLFQTASYQFAKMEEHPDLKIVDRWILRLGKNEDEAGKFEPWHMEPSDFEKDFAGFLACLTLTRIVDEVDTRMKDQKKLIRAVRKEIKEAAKLIQKEQEKLAKALAKAEAKKLKEAEKLRIKEEAKAKREADKAAKKTKVIANTKEITCTSTLKQEEETSKSVTTPPLSTGTQETLVPTTSSPSNPNTIKKTMEVQNDKQDKQQPTVFTTSTVVVTEAPVQYKPIELPGEK